MEEPFRSQKEYDYSKDEEIHDLKAIIKTLEDKLKVVNENDLSHPVINNEVAVKGCHTCKHNPHAPFVPEICESCHAPKLNNWQPLTDC